jgi:hypothetical protein
VKHIAAKHHTRCVSLLKPPLPLYTKIDTEGCLNRSFKTLSKQLLPWVARHQQQTAVVLLLLAAAGSMLTLRGEYY